MNVVISDMKLPSDTNSDGTVDFWLACVLSVNDYYAFGQEMPGRNYNSDKYRFGYNGKEMDNEVKGAGAQYDYGFRIYDTRLGRFLSTDPLFNTYPFYTPYQFAGNNPVRYIDLDGLEEADKQIIDAKNTGKSQINVVKTIDLSNKLKWKTQAPNWSACKITCEAILAAANITLAAKSEAIQIAEENKLHTQINHTPNFTMGVEAIDKTLEKGQGIMVGVNHTLNYSKTSSGINENPGTNATTDHFVVIYSVSYDEDKKQKYYKYYDVGNTNESKGTSDNNRLYLDTQNQVLGQTKDNSLGKKYTVSQVRKNKEQALPGKETSTESNPPSKSN